MKLRDAIKSLGEERAAQKLSSLSPEELEWVNSNLDTDIDPMEYGLQQGRYFDQPTAFNEFIGTMPEGEQMPQVNVNPYELIGPTEQAMKGAGQFYAGNAYTEAADIGRGLSRFTGGYQEGEIPAGYEDVIGQLPDGEQVPIVRKADLDTVYNQMEALRNEGAKNIGSGFTGDALRMVLGLTSPVNIAVMAMGGKDWALPAMAGAGYFRSMGHGKGAPTLKEGTVATLEQVPTLAFPVVGKLANPTGQSIVGLIKQAIGVGAGGNLAGEPFKYAAAKISGKEYHPSTAGDVLRLGLLHAFFSIRGETERLKEINKFTEEAKEGKLKKTDEAIRGLVKKLDPKDAKELKRILQSVEIQQTDNGVQLSFDHPLWGHVSIDAKDIYDLVNTQGGKIDSALANKVLESGIRANYWIDENGNVIPIAQHRLVTPGLKALPEGTNAQSQQTPTQPHGNVQYPQGPQEGQEMPTPESSQGVLGGRPGEEIPKETKAQESPQEMTSDELPDDQLQLIIAHDKATPEGIKEFEESLYPLLSERQKRMWDEYEVPEAEGPKLEEIEEQPQKAQEIAPLPPKTTAENAPESIPRPTQGVSEGKTEKIENRPTEGRKKAIRFEAGKKLTPAQKREVLANIGDAYKDNEAPLVEKGTDKDGEIIYGYEYNPEYMHKSDITGQKIRHYITLPDGRIAHPSELFPNISEKDIAKAIGEAREYGNQIKMRADELERRRADNIADVNLNARKAGWTNEIFKDSWMLKKGDKYVRARTKEEIAELRKRGYKKLYKGFPKEAPKQKQPWEMMREKFIAENSLRPAIRDVDTGEIKVGERGQVHADLYNKFTKPEARRIESGWVDRNGEYVNFKEAQKINRAKDAIATWKKLGEKHEAEVIKAAAEGKPVPPEVLKDYPDLIPLAIDETIKPAKKRMAAATGAMRGLRPSEYDWMTEEEHKRVHELQMLLPKTDREAARERVKQKRAARKMAAEMGIPPDQLPPEGELAPAMRDKDTGEIYPGKVGGIHAEIEAAQKGQNVESGWIDHTGKFMTTEEARPLVEEWQKRQALLKKEAKVNEAVKWANENIDRKGEMIYGKEHGEYVVNGQKIWYSDLTKKFYPSKNTRMVGETEWKHQQESIQAKEEQSKQQEEPVESVKPDGTVKLHAGVSPQEALEQIKTLYDDAVKKAAKNLGIDEKRVGEHFKEKLGIPPHDITKRLGRYFSFVETLARKYGKEHPEVQKMWEALVERGEKNTRGGRMWLKVENVIKKADNPDKVYSLLLKHAFTTDEAEVARDLAKLTPRDRAAYKRIRGALKAVWQDRINLKKQKLLEIANNYTFKKQGLPPEDLRQIREAINKADPSLVPDKYKRFKNMVQELADARQVPYYIPQSRKGPWLVGVYDKEGKPQFAISAPTRAMAEAMMNRIKSGDYSDINNWYKQLGAGMKAENQRIDLLKGLKSGEFKTSYKHTQHTPWELTQGLSKEKTRGVIEAFLKNYGEKGKASIQEDLLNQLDEFLKLTGWSAHTLARKGKNPAGVPGFDLDNTGKALENYVRGYYASKTKGEALEKIIPELYSLLHKKNAPVNLTKAMNDAVTYAFSEPEAASILNTIFTHYYLSGRIKSPVVNATQNLTSGAAAYLHNKIPLQELPKALKDVMTGKLSRSEKVAIARLMKDGDAEPLVLKEQLGKNIAKWDVGLLPFKAIETWWNRIPHFLGAYRHLIKKGVDPELAYKQAKEIMLEGHYRAERYNRPAATRGAFRPFTALQTFTYHYLKQALMYAGEKDYKALGWLLLSPVALGGLSGYKTFKDILAPLYKKLTKGRDLHTDLVSGKYGDIVNYGIMGYLSPSVASSLSVNIGGDTPERTVLGVPYDLLKRGEKAWKLYKKGDWYKGSEVFAPPAVGDIFKAYEGRKGVTTTTGMPVLTKENEIMKFSPSEAIQRALGFVPKRLQKAYDVMGLQKKWKSDRQDMMNKITTTYRTKGIAAAYKQLTEYDKRMIKWYLKFMAKAQKSKENSDLIQALRYANLFIPPESVQRSIMMKQRGLPGITRPSKQMHYILSPRSK